MPANQPLPTQLSEDPRVHFDTIAGKYQYEDEDTGKEYEWNGQTWVELVRRFAKYKIDEDQWKAQQAAYTVAGVDENTPSNAVVAREERRASKKKGESSKGIKPPRPPPQPSAPKKTGVWVTNLPPNTDVPLLSSVFSKAGVLLIGDDGEPRIKMYYNDEGRFKGEALVVYFKEGSVQLAITLLDDTELEMGAGFGNMRVREADYGAADKQDEKKPAETPKAEPNGSSAEVKGEKGEKRKPPTAEEKQRMTKRIRRMQDKLTWHSDSESDDPAAPAEGAPAPLASRFNRVVVLKGMFALEDLQKDPALLLDLKEDVREEAETLGQVTSVVLYDKEEDGVMTIKFKDAISAEACVMKMNGRFFDGRKIYAGLYTGKERFRKSGGIRDFGDEEEESQEERQRLDNFANWLVDGGPDGDEKP